MILPDLVLPSHSNQRWPTQGIDSREHCGNRVRFDSYAWPIEYVYNSRGFRDVEWPHTSTELKNAVWCVGDSFTSGTGCPESHRWSNKLQSQGYSTINVAMDGASNQWIARAVQQIDQAVSPANIVVMWSYTHRREQPDSNLDSAQRRLHYVKSTVAQDWQNFLDCRQQISDCKANIVEFAVPQFHPIDLVTMYNDWNSVRSDQWPKNPPNTVEELMNLPPWILKEIQHQDQWFNVFYEHLSCSDYLSQHNITLVEIQDLARDGHHFDRITADWVVLRIVPRLA